MWSSSVILFYLSIRTAGEWKLPNTLFTEKDCVNIKVRHALNAPPEVDSFTSGCFFMKHQCVFSERWHSHFSFFYLPRTTKESKEQQKEPVGKQYLCCLLTHISVNYRCLFLSHPPAITLRLSPIEMKKDTDLCQFCGLSVTQTALISHISIHPGDFSIYTCDTNMWQPGFSC